MLSTNEALAGVTAVIGITNLLVAAWLIWTLACQIIRLKPRLRNRHKSALAIILERDPLRITLGFILKTIVIGLFFLMRLPLRVLRDAGMEAEGARYLDATVYWELPGMFILLVGLSLIMWPAFTKWASLRQSVPVAIAGTGLVFLFGALGVGWAADWLR